MAGFNYILSVTGDCSSTNAGAISILPIDGTPPYTIEWVDPPLPPDEILTFTASTRTNLNYGYYVVRLNDSTEPVNESFYVNIYVSSGSSVSVTGLFDTTCGNNNGSVSATSNSDMSSTYYELFDFSGNSLNSSTTDVTPVVFTELSAGTYYIEATDLGGCSSKTATFVIEDSSPVDFGFYAVPNSRCSQFNTPTGKLYITGQTGQPPFTYVWSVAGTGSTITGLTNDFYSCTVTDSLGCSTTKNIYLDDVEPLGLFSFQSVEPTCFAANGSLTIFVTGGTAPYYYSASTGDVQISYAQNFTISGVSAGAYNFQVTDAGLCQIFAGSILTTPQSIGSVTVNTINSSCSISDGQIQISVFQGNPPFNYTLIYPDSSTQNITINTPNYVFQNLSTGDYGIIVSDQGGCAYTQDVSIFTSNLYTISTYVTGTTCNQSNGAIYVSLSEGGTPPYTYSLDGVSQFVETSLTAVTFTSISNGSHVVSVSDANGCVQNETVSITTSSDLNFNLFSTDCGNGQDGTITVMISSGQPPFKFYWSDNVVGNPQTITLSNLSADTYTLTIIDSNGCSLERQTEITCTSEIIGLYEFPVSVNELSVDTEKYAGLLELLNDGFNDLTGGDPNCILNNATFEAYVEVSPAGLSASEIFYTAKNLNDVPPDNLWTASLKNLLLSLPGVLNVYVDETNNQITIQKNPSSNFLDYQIINLNLDIDYDIDC